MREENSTVAKIFRGGRRMLSLALLCVFAPFASAESIPPFHGQNWEAIHLSPRQLMTWNRWGSGRIQTFRNEALELRESENGKGLMLTSPEAYEAGVVLKYEVMTLRPATVLVAMLSASDFSKKPSLNLPENYDGGMEPWVGGHQHYFFAFNNAAHSRMPFVVRNAPGDWRTLAESDRAFMKTGVWHSVEAGRIDDSLWLKIDGETVLKVDDPAPFGAGFLALRIRGTGLEAASCMIRNVTIHHRP